jgi:hypothetical protein
MDDVGADRDRRLVQVHEQLRRLEHRREHRERDDGGPHREAG